MTLLLLFAAGGGALPAPQPVTEIIVTGSRMAAPADELAANITVLRREDFDVEKAATLPDLLARVAGVHIDQVGGRGGTSSLYMRGADPNYTLVLVDGVRVNDPTNARGGSFDFSSFDVDDVERVEIARGPYSAVYGGDALAGVVNIITRREPRAETALSLSAMGGAYGTHEVSLGAAGPAGGGSWHFGASDSQEGETVRGNHFDSQRVSGGFDATIGDTRIFTNARYAEAERAGFPDDSGGFGFAAIREPETRDASEAVFGAGASTRVGGATFGLTLGYFERDEEVESPGIAPGVRDPFGVPPSLVETNLTRYTATLTGTQRISDLMSIAYGVDWQREEGASDGELDFGGGFVMPTSFGLTRTSWAPFAEIRVASSSGFSAQAGVRLDKPDDAGSVTSPRLRLAYEFAHSGLTLAAAWGKAYKLPSLYALGHPLVGNPDLVPERGESHELELSQELRDGKARWSATWFDGAFRNSIDFDAGPPPMLVNRNRVDTQGFELAGQVDVSDAWQLDASVTHARSEIAGSGAQLRNRPEWRGGLAAHFTPVAALRFSATATHVGPAFDSSIATGDVRLNAWTRFDVSAVWQVSPTIEAWLAVENLSDERYEQFVGFEARGIAPRAGIKLVL